MKGGALDVGKASTKSFYWTSIIIIILNYIVNSSYFIMIQVKNIYKSFDQSDVLKEINTSFDRGKTNLIIGQSGSGKTVLLKCLLAYMILTQGKYYMMALAQKV